MAHQQHSCWWAYLKKQAKTVRRACPHLQQGVSSARVPSHWLTLRHSFVDHLVDHGFHTRCDDRLPMPVAVPELGNEARFTLVLSQLPTVTQHDEKYCMSLVTIAQQARPQERSLTCKRV
jgi:hypothetical protein